MSSSIKLATFRLTPEQISFLLDCLGVCEECPNDDPDEVKIYKTLHDETKSVLYQALGRWSADDPNAIIKS